MPATPHASGSDRTTDSNQVLAELWTRCKAIARELVMVFFAVVWTGFWISIAKLHYFDGDILGVAVTALLIVPGIGLVLWRLSRIGTLVPGDQTFDQLTDRLGQRFPTPDLE
ncbi:MAG: hypothetical protein ABEJ48_03645 [Halobacteriales archaeon]